MNQNVKKTRTHVLQKFWQDHISDKNGRRDNILPNAQVVPKTAFFHSVTVMDKVEGWNEESWVESKFEACVCVEFHQCRKVWWTATAKWRPKAYVRNHHGMCKLGMRGYLVGTWVGDRTECSKEGERNFGNAELRNRCTCPLQWGLLWFYSSSKRKVFKKQARQAWVEHLVRCCLQPEKNKDEKEIVDWTARERTLHRTQKGTTRIAEAMWGSVHWQGGDERDSTEQDWLPRKERRTTFHRRRKNWWNHCRLGDLNEDQDEQQQGQRTTKCHRKWNELADAHEKKKKKNTIVMCFQERFISQMESPSSWKVVKFVFLMKQDAVGKKEIRS